MTRARTIMMSDVAACPITSLLPQHYRLDATCACGEVCGWFPVCDRPAATFLDHPVLGEVPLCDHCRTKAEAL
jgi:hypothetical protein